MENKPEFLIVHTEASLVTTNAPRFNTINQHHQQRLFNKSSLGFYVGYHYFIEKSGQLIQARTDTDEGMHTKGFNLKSLSICLAGNGDMELPTKEQTETLKKWLNEKALQYNIPKDKVLPHRRFLGRNEKTCYGKLLEDNWASSFIELSDIKKIEELRVIQLNLLQRILSVLQAQLQKLLSNKLGSINMESKYSLTQGGNLVVIAGFIVMIARHYRFDIAESEVVAVLGGIVTAVGIIISWWGRYRQGDVTIGGWKK